MSLRGPAAPRRKTWRRSGDESYWDSLQSEPLVSCPIRGSRPQSAVEGGQLDGWLKQLQRIQNKPVHNQFAPFNDFNSSLPGLDKEAPGSTWRQKWGVPSSRGSSSGGSLSHCDSPLGSQESLHSGLLSPPERRENWEKAHISQAPKKEQTRVSFLTPVKVGWLPIRRKVMMVGDQARNTDAGQVKLKQPITPTLLKNASPIAKSCNDEEVERRHSGPRAAGVKTWQQPDQESANVGQVPEKRVSAVNEADRPVSWQALKRGWKLNRVLALPGGNQPSNKSPNGTSTDPQQSKPLIEPPNCSHERTTSADQSSAPLPGTNSTVAYKAPLHRTSSVQPIKASHIETSSAATTLIPRNKAGFSSITISSRKVCRSASLPSSGSRTTDQQPMDTNPRQVMVQRKATIVKVTEQRVTSSSGQNQPASYNVDTVVHRRKATIIKVTEHRESYTPANVKNSHYRHSYSEGLYNGMWSQGNRQDHQNPSQNSSTVPIDSKPMHRSTMNLLVTSPPAISAPPVAPSEVSSSSAKSDGPQRRPTSCYSDVFGNSEPAEEKVSRPVVARKWSLGSSQGVGGGKSDSSLNINGTRVPPRAEANKSKGSEDATAPALTLIKTPDAHHTADEVLALNAAAIIANIKLQGQLSKKKTPNGECEKDSAPLPQEKTVTAVGECTKPDNCSERVHSQTRAAFVSLSSNLQRSTQNISLQEALQRSRPDFISRSRTRLQRLEQRAQERRHTAQSAQSKIGSNHRAQARGGRLKEDNLFKAKDRSILVKDMQLPSKRPTEVKRKQEEVAKRDLCLNNRQRAELFKKKLLDQVLQRSNN